MATASMVRWYVKGEKDRFNHPEDAIEAGIAYVTEDRKGDGLILIQDVKQNITLANLKQIANRGVVDSNCRDPCCQRIQEFAQHQDPID